MEQNEALMRRWFDEVWNQRRLETIEELFAEDGVSFGMLEGGGGLAGPGQWRLAHTAFCEAIPDLKIEILEVIAAPDSATVRFVGRGTHDGPFLGIPASGRPLAVTGICIAHLRDGQITQSWNAIDLLGLLQQIGAVPKIAEIAAAKLQELSPVE